MSYRTSTSHALRRPTSFLCALAGAAACAAVAVSAGCSSNEGTGTVPDMGTTPMYSYTTTTIHQIDTDPGNGPFGNGQRVQLDRVVAVTKVDKYVNATNQQCRYQIWVQDPKCTTPPCGMVVKAIGPMAPSATSSGKDCPSARTSGTMLDTVDKGDNVRIKGKLLVEVDSTPPMTVVEHQLFVESIEILTPDLTVNPLVLSDSAVFAQFVESQGTTWNKYEGMYVTLQPSAGTLQVATFGSSGFTTLPGKTNWGDTFDGDYYPSGATTFPTVGSTFRSISGVVSTRHGGEIMPTRNKDFVP